MIDYIYLTFHVESSMDEKKKNKVRTSITIDPDLLAEVRKDAEQSVSSYIEKAILFYRRAHSSGSDDL